MYNFVTNSYICKNKKEVNDGWTLVIAPQDHRFENVRYKIKTFAVFAEILARLNEEETALLMAHYCGIFYDEELILEQCHGDHREVTSLFVKIKCCYDSVNPKMIDYDKTLDFADYLMANREDEYMLARHTGLSLLKIKTILLFMRLTKPSLS